MKNCICNAELLWNEHNDIVATRELELNWNLTVWCFRCTQKNLHFSRSITTKNTEEDKLMPCKDQEKKIKIRLNQQG